MTENLLIKNLAKPEAYPHPVQAIKVLETHVSWIILTGEYAYKIKKAVDYGFLDYSTLDKRKFYCEQEVTLNKLLAPDLYLDVVTINGTHDAPEVNGAGAVLEYAVKMREFPQKDLFTEVLASQRLTAVLIDELATMVADFHLKTSVAAAETRFGLPEQVHAPVLQNFEQITPFLQDSADLQQLERMRNWSEMQYKIHYALLKRRKEQGFIRDCHGDLHLRNIVLYDQHPVLFDRIEFNDDFRWTDIMAEIAFLAMDLDEHQQTSHTWRFLNGYFSITGDYEGLLLLRYYQVYRAIVRAKVSLFELMNTSLQSNEQQKIRRKYRSLMALAERYTERRPQVLLIMYGLPGVGKSTVANLLTQNIEQLIRVRSDIERKRLFGFAPEARTHASLNTGIYAEHATLKTYEHLMQCALVILQGGYSAVVDASFYSRTQRQLLQDLAIKLQIPFLIVECVAPKEYLQNWIREREIKNNDPSEANLAVLDLLQQNMEPLREEERAVTVTIDTVQLDIKSLTEMIRSKIK